MKALVRWAWIAAVLCASGCISIQVGTNSSARVSGTGSRILSGADFEVGPQVATCRVALGAGISLGYWDGYLPTLAAHGSYYVSNRWGLAGRVAYSSRGPDDSKVTSGFVGAVWRGFADRVDDSSRLVGGFFQVAAGPMIHRQHSIEGTRWFLGLGLRVQAGVDVISAFMPPESEFEEPKDYPCRDRSSSGQADERDASVGDHPGHEARARDS